MIIFMKKLCFLLFFIFYCSGIYGQIAGDYRTNGSGNWNQTGIWQTYNGTAWVAAIVKPGLANSVFIQSTHVITLTGDESVNNLNIAKGTSNTNTNKGSLMLATFNINVNGYLRCYYATINTIPGTDTSASLMGLITANSGTSGTIKFVGNSRNITNTGQWGYDNTGNTQNFAIEIALNAGEIATMQTFIKPKSWTVTSGILNAGNNRICIDNGTTGQGDFIIKSNGTVRSSQSSSGNLVMARTGNYRAGTLTIQAGGLLQLYGDNPCMDMNAISNSGTIEYCSNNSQSLLQTGNDASSAVINNYYDLKLSGSNAKSLSVNITVNNSLILNGNASLLLNSKTLTYGNSAVLIYSGQSLQTTSGQEFPDVGGPYNLTINNPNGVNLHSNKTINGTLTLITGSLNTEPYYSRISPTGNINLTTGYVNGKLEKYYPVTAGEISNSFEIGTANGYSPCILPLKGITSPGYLRVKAYQTTPPGVIKPEECLTRYWEISVQSGLIFASYKNAQFYYLPLDFNGVQFIESTDEPSMKIGKYNGSEWGFVNSTIHCGGINDGGDYLITDELTTFSTFSAGKDNGSLPVELKSFTSEIKSNNVKLNWVTEIELNNSGFEVYRKLQNDIDWCNIGFVRANGTCNNKTYYSYEDEKLAAGNYNYELKQIDINGHYKYFMLSGIVEITMPKAYNLSQNYPNPFNPTTKIDYDLPFDSKVKILIYDIMGRKLKTVVNEFKTAGYYTVEFNGVNLASGIYFYRILANANEKDFIVTKKMALIK